MLSFLTQTLLVTTQFFGNANSKVNTISNDICPNNNNYPQNIIQIFNPMCDPTSYVQLIDIKTPNLNEFQPVVRIEKQSLDNKGYKLSLDPEDYLRQSKDLLKEEKIDDAIKSIKTTIELRTEPNPRDYSLLGKLLSLKGEYEDAITAYKTAIDLRGNTIIPEDYYELGISYFHHGDYPNAINAIKTAIANREYPNHLDHNALGMTYLARGELSNAIEQFKLAIQLRGDQADSENYYSLGTAYYQSGLYRNAIQALVTSNRLRENLDPNDQNLIGLAYLQMGDAESAISYFELSIGLRSENDVLPNEYHNLALALFSNNQFQETITAINQVIEVRANRGDPTNPEDYYLLGRAYYENGQFSEAVNAFATNINLRLELGETVDSTDYFWLNDALYHSRYRYENNNVE